MGNPSRAQDIEKETENQIEHLDDMTGRFKHKECRRIAWIGALKLMTGDLVEIVVRGKVDSTFQGRFWCFNPSFGWVLIKTDDNDLLIKLKDIKYIRKLKK